MMMFFDRNVSEIGYLKVGDDDEQRALPTTMFPRFLTEEAEREGPQRHFLLLLLLLLLFDAATTPEDCLRKPSRRRRRRDTDRTAPLPPPPSPPPPSRRPRFLLLTRLLLSSEFWRLFSSWCSLKGGIESAFPTIPSTRRSHHLLLLLLFRTSGKSLSNPTSNRLRSGRRAAAIRQFSCRKENALF